VVSARGDVWDEEEYVNLKGRAASTFEAVQPPPWTLCAESPRDKLC
jgi:hypothetical protein